MIWSNCCRIGDINSDEMCHGYRGYHFFLDDPFDILLLNNHQDSKSDEFNCMENNDLFIESVCSYPKEHCTHVANNLSWPRHAARSTPLVYRSSWLPVPSKSKSHGHGVSAIARSARGARKRRLFFRNQERVDIASAKQTPLEFRLVNDRDFLYWWRFHWRACLVI